MVASPLSLTPAEETIFTFVQRYARAVRFIGAGVLGKVRGGVTREAHWLAEVGDAAAFDAALVGRKPFAGAFSEGNTLFFIHEGVEFTIENLVPEAFARRLVELATPRTVAFAHDGLSYDPATQTMRDPFGAEKSQAVKLVNTTIAGGAAIGTAMRGRLQAARLGVGGDGRFTTWQARNLGLGASANTARAVVRTFLGKLATLAETLAPAEMKTLLRSRAVSTALFRIFGIRVAAVIANFDRLRDGISGEFSNAALWLALLLRPEIETDKADGAATTWLVRGSRFDVLRSRAALAQAQQLISAQLISI